MDVITWILCIVVLAWTIQNIVFMILMAFALRQSKPTTHHHYYWYSNASYAQTPKKLWMFLSFCPESLHWGIHYVITMAAKLVNREPRDIKIAQCNSCDSISLAVQMENQQIQCIKCNHHNFPVEMTDETKKNIISRLRNIKVDKNYITFT